MNAPRRLIVPFALAAAGIAASGALAGGDHSQFLSGTVVATPRGALVLRVDHTSRRAKQLLGRTVTVSLPSSVSITAAKGSARVAAATIQPGWRAGVFALPGPSTVRWVAVRVRVKAAPQRFVLGLVTSVARGSVTLAVQKATGRAQRLVGHRLRIAVDRSTRVVGGAVAVGDRVGALVTQGADGLRAIRLRNKGKPAK